MDRDMKDSFTISKLQDPARSWVFTQELQGAEQGGFNLKPAHPNAASRL